MPTNLPPQYHEAEKRYRTARTTPEKVAALQEMLAVMPKHKGTDHLKADLRSRIAKLMDELERPTGARGAARAPSRQGASPPTPPPPAPGPSPPAPWSSTGTRAACAPPTGARAESPRVPTPARRPGACSRPRRPRAPRPALCSGSLMPV
ncbi:MAG: hypothetical protein ACE5IZ_06770, partial [Dehalococcoidia bacterium]